MREVSISRDTNRDKASTSIKHHNKSERYELLRSQTHRKIIKSVILKALSIKTWPQVSKNESLILELLCILLW